MIPILKLKNRFTPLPLLFLLFSILFPLSWALNAQNTPTSEEKPQSLTPAQSSSLPANARKPQTELEKKAWLENMVRYHRFTPHEVQEATGLSEAAIQKSLDLYGISQPPLSSPPWSQEALFVLPYPGGRHPRIGFLEGAIEPQRETKLSVFTPWDLSSYVVIDVPEALWSNLGLTYLAHTHIPTVWDRQQKTLPTLEWEGDPVRGYSMERRLPNGIVFGTRAVPAKGGLQMEMFLFNGSDQPLNDLRVQNCVMLKMADGFNQQTNDNKLIRKPYVACHSPQKDRWIITAWLPCDRPWTNPPVPCLHSDPKFPDCQPGKTQTLHGWFSFYQGTQIQEELDRLDALEWWKP